MKFTVSYSRKVKAGKAYEMMEIFGSTESDTAIETMEQAFHRVQYFVDSKIEKERERLLETSVKRPEVSEK